VGHAVTKAKDRGWDTLSNGDLLAPAEDAGFDLLVIGVVSRLGQGLDPLVYGATSETAFYWTCCTVRRKFGGDWTPFIVATMGWSPSGVDAGIWIAI